MILYDSWIKDHPLDDGRKWWVLGKGPSLDRYTEFVGPHDLAIGLNDVCLIHHVFMSHVIDADAVTRVGRGSFDYLVVPYYLHVNNLPASDRPIPYYLKACRENDEPVAKVLRCAATAKRLLVYRSSLCGRIPHPAGIGKPLTTINFSSEPATELLLRGGVRDINLLGVDGGTDYSKSFSDLTPLTNGVKSFDVQFEILRKLAQKYQAKLHHPLKEIV